MYPVATVATVTRLLTNPRMVLFSTYKEKRFRESGCVVYFRRFVLQY